VVIGTDCIGTFLGVLLSCLCPLCVLVVILKKQIIWFSNHLVLRIKFESRSGELYSIQHYVMELISDLRQVGGFLRGFQFFAD
jgi:hypothetical protein